MDLDQLKQILALVREHELAEFEVEHDGLRLKIRRDTSGGVAPARAAEMPGIAVPFAGAGAVPSAARLAGAQAVAVAAPDGDLELAVVKSPIVGTFYRSAEPDSPPFVEVGTTVKKGQVLCIIEAMKLMNEIDSEYDGEVVNVYVENGQPVQYGERLFAIKTK
jgi:acetyl-CoA carboxylase biotin carboxyl carrier protein